MCVWEVAEFTSKAKNKVLEIFLYSSGPFLNLQLHRRLTYLPKLHFFTDFIALLLPQQVVAISPHILDLCLFMRQNFKRQKGTVKCDGSPYLSQWVKNGEKIQ